MKRTSLFISFLFICICLVAQTTKTYTMTFNRDAFSILSTEEGDYIKSDEYDLVLEDDTLKPAIPYVVANILLPDMEEIDTYSMTVGGTTTTNGVNLAANPTYIPMSCIQTDSYTTATSSYPMQNYPVKIEFEDTEIMDGYSIAVFKVFPLAYNANSSTVTWASSVNITITTKLREDATRVEATHQGTMTEILDDILLNPEEMTTPISTLSNNEKFDYLIITSSLLAESFQPLADWRTTRGLRSKIITTEEIYSTFAGESNQLKIKYCLKHYYSTYGTKYVLLGGDSNIIPVQGCYAEVAKKGGKEIDNTIPTDLFYVCFDKSFNWNKNNNSLIGEPNDNLDLKPEMYISRFPVQNTTDANTVVTKTITYEQNPPLTGRYSTMLLAGAYLHEYADDGHSDAEKKSDKMYNNYIKKYWKTGIPTRFFDTDTDFPNGASYQVNPENLQEQLNTGYHFVNMDTHGNEYSWGMEGNYSNYYTTNANVMQNSQPCIITTSACSTNSFDAYSTCLSEAFIRNPNNGVIAYLGGSRYGWNTLGINNLGNSLKLNGEFYKALFTQKEKYFAQLVTHAKSKLSGNTRNWILYSVNAIGDPALAIYTDNPNTFSNATYYWDGTRLQVNMNTEKCTMILSGISEDGTKLFQKYEKVSQYTFTNLPSGTYNLCVLKENYVPFVIKDFQNEISIQNETITGTKTYSAKIIKIGNNVTSGKPTGDVHVQNANVTIHSTGTVTLDAGVYVEKGSSLSINE